MMMPSNIASVAIVSPFSYSIMSFLNSISIRSLRTHPPSRLSAVSEDLPRSRAGFHGSLVRPSASGRVARFWLMDCKTLRFAYKRRDAASPLRPVADDIGLTRRYQRSICVTAALPAPRQGRKINYTFALRALTKSLIFSPSSRTDSPLLKRL